MSLQDRMEASLRHPPTATVVCEGKAPLRAVFLEDDPDMLKIILESWSLVREPLRPTVAVTDDPDWALAFILKQPERTVLITDIFMPREDGREFARRVREVAPETAIVFMTAAAPDRVNGSSQIADETVYKGTPNYLNNLLLLVPILSMQRCLELTNARMRDRRLTIK